MGIQPTTTITISLEEHKQIVQDYERRIKLNQQARLDAMKDKSMAELDLECVKRSSEKVRMDRQRIEGERDAAEAAVHDLATALADVGTMTKTDGNALMARNNELLASVEYWQTLADKVKEQRDRNAASIEELDKLNENLNAVAKRLGSGELAVLRQEKLMFERCNVNQRRTIVEQRAKIKALEERVESQRVAIRILQGLEDHLKAKLSEELRDGEG